MYCEITGDVLCIAERLKQINGDYRVFWNNRDGRYEVHTGLNPNMKTLAFCVPFDVLDTRTLDRAQKTRKENADAIEEEVEEHNNALSQDIRKNLKKAAYSLADMFAYANGQSHPVIFTKNYVKEF